MRVKSESRRQAIVEAAAEVFLERGYEAASMAEIAARVGGSKATLYNYYPSKEELFRVVMKTQAEDRMMKAFGSLVPCDDLVGTLQQFGEHYLGVILSQDFLIMRCIVMGEGPRSSMGRMFFNNGPAEGWGQLAQFLEGEMVAGRMRPGQPWRAALHLINLLEADFLELFMTGTVERPGAEQIIESVTAAVEVFLRGYVPHRCEPSCGCDCAKRTLAQGAAPVTDDRLPMVKVKAVPSLHGSSVEPLSSGGVG